VRSIRRAADRSGVAVLYWRSGIAIGRIGADKAIAALGVLADDIAKLAEARAQRPWWRRLARA
jgi:hypothetical protein